MEKTTCFHCGADCITEQIKVDEKDFCCQGCVTVYKLFEENDLGCYYDFENNPGSIPKELSGKFHFLESEDIQAQLLEFNSGDHAIMNFYIPSIHCSSCVWILENLSKLNPAISQSLVNFPNKTVRVHYNPKKTSLKSIAELLASIAYEPYISLDSIVTLKQKSSNRLTYQLSVAAFGFGNIMLLSFPEYFQVDEFWLEKYKYVFRYLMLIMALPVLFYSAQDYFITAWKGLKKGILNIDVPISLGISVLFLRSLVEIVFDLGSGFLDSLTGLIFFLLLGKFFQQRTYNYLSFERDYKSYFPIAITVIEEGEERTRSVNDLKTGDRILIHNEELIPADGVLMKGEAFLDYAFVTGESNPVEKMVGESVYAGAKHLGNRVEIEITKSVNNSYLTELWSNEAFSKDKDLGIKGITDRISKRFTFIVLSIATIAGIYWSSVDLNIAVDVVSAVLIIACPCALALSAPFTLGNMLRIFGRKGIYLKNTLVIEKMAKIGSIVFDKTGTMTSSLEGDFEFISESGLEFNTDEIYALVRNSNHPLSRRLTSFLKQKVNAVLETEDFNEIPGKGVSAIVDGHLYKVGSAGFIDYDYTGGFETSIFLSVDDNFIGRFVLKNRYRPGLKRVFQGLSKTFNLSVLSGDNKGELKYLRSILPETTDLNFDQSPRQKLEFIENIQKDGSTCMMIGDGLNDAGALAQSDVGLALSEDVNVFSPACDGIVAAEQFDQLPQLMDLSKRSMKIINWSFLLSFSYNIIGMYFALTHQLTPLVAAILMPLSSITVVGFVTVLTNYSAKSLKNNS
jgi:Cu+-exporting ATPase